MSNNSEFGQPDETRQITQKDVADRAGVSRAVVSYVVNNGPRVVSPETRERVLKAIEDLGYRPNKHAQRLKVPVENQAAGQIGLIMGGNSKLLERPYFATVLAGIYEAAARRKQQIRFMTFFDELNDPVFFNRNIHPEEISGLIVIATELVVRAPNATALLDRIIERIDNIVTLEQVIDGLPAVIFDRPGAARMAVSHLLKLGHRRVGYAGTVDNRLDGYREALLNHGLSYDETLVVSPGMMHEPHDGSVAVQQLMALDTPPTAIFATSDEVASGVLATLYDQRIKVPEQVAVTSIDDGSMAQYLRPSLTTVRVPKQNFGTYALQMLAMHDSLPDTQPASVVLPTELIIRESCGARQRTGEPLATR